MNNISTIQCMFGRYHVALIDGEWHVLFEPDHLRRQFVSVARFQDEERATSYACVENDLGGDPDFCNDAEDIHAVTDLSKQPIKAIQVIPSTKKLPDVERDLSDFEKEVLADLPGLMKQYPYGASPDELKEWYGVNTGRANLVIKTLDARGLAKKVHWPDEGDATNRLIAIGHERPEMRVTDQHRAVLRGMHKLAVGGVVAVSQTAIANAAGLNKLQMDGILYRLERMGLIDPVELKPGSVFPSKYKFTDDGTKAISCSVTSAERTGK